MIIDINAIGVYGKKLAKSTIVVIKRWLQP